MTWTFYMLKYILYNEVILYFGNNDIFSVHTVSSIVMPNKEVTCLNIYHWTAVLAVPMAR